MVRQDNKIFAMLGMNCTGDLGPFTFYKDYRGDRVFFPRMPALNPPSNAQIAQRNKYRAAAAGWQLLPETEKANWELASKRCSLKITGYNLWVYLFTTGDIPPIRTVEHQSNLALL